MQGFLVRLLIMLAVLALIFLLLKGIVPGFDESVKNLVCYAFGNC